MGAQEQITRLEEILNNSRDHLTSCKSMQLKVQTQVGLEDEILSKVDEQYNLLKQIIDEQKDEAKNIIRNLESVQNYKPPP